MLEGLVPLLKHVQQPLQHNQHSHVVYFGIRALYSSFAMIQYIMNFQMGY